MTERKQETGKRKGETRAEREHERRYRRIRRELARGNMPLLLDAYLASRLRYGHIEEATKIFEALKRVLPYIKDNDPHPDGASDFHEDGIPKLGIDKETNSSIDSAAGFMQTAARLLTQAHKLEQLEQSKQEKKLRASETNSCNLASSRNNQEESHTGIQGEVTSTTQDGNSFEQDNSCPEKEDLGLEKNVSAPFAEHKEVSPETETPSVNKEEQASAEDITGHLSVSLDEGIIRPIEGLTAIQRVVLACVVGHPGYSAAKISDSTGIPQSLIDRHIAILTDRDLIEHRDNSDTSGYYPL